MTHTLCALQTLTRLPRECLAIRYLLQAPLTTLGFAITALSTLSSFFIDQHRKSIEHCLWLPLICLQAAKRIHLVGFRRHRALPQPPQIPTLRHVTPIASHPSIAPRTHPPGNCLPLCHLDLPHLRRPLFVLSRPCSPQPSFPNPKFGCSQPLVSAPHPLLHAPFGLALPPVHQVSPEPH